MNRIHITRIIPVSDQILLLVFMDTKFGIYDAKFLLHHIPDLKPRSNTDGFKSFLRENRHVFAEWAHAIEHDIRNYGGETTEVTLSIPADEWAEMNTAFTEMHITIEQVAVALANFSIEPGAADALDQWFDEHISEKIT